MRRALWTRSGGEERLLGSLLAAGWPSFVGTDGVRIGWVVRDRLFLEDRERDRVWLVELPDAAEGVWPDPAGWVVALGQGFVTVDPVRAEVAAAVLDDESDPVETRVGRDVGVYVEAPSHRALQLRDGQPLILPEGAARSRWLVPWGTETGVIWVDAETVYRMSGVGRIAAVGRARGTLEACAGPRGAAVIRGRSGSLLLAPRGFGVEGPKMEAVRFSGDGERVLATDEAGALEVRLSNGEVVARWTGPYDPVGYLDGDRVVHDRGTGALRSLGGGELGSGFCGARPAQLGQVLAGPGGRVWTFGDETAGFGGLVDGLVAVGEGGVVVHADDSVRILVHGREHARIAVDDVVGVTMREGKVRVETAGGAAVYDLDGRPCAEPAPLRARRTTQRGAKVAVAGGDEESEVCWGSTTWPVPADHAVPVGPGVWAWSDDGALYALR